MTMLKESDMYSLIEKFKCSSILLTNIIELKNNSTKFVNIT